MHLEISLLECHAANTLPLEIVERKGIDARKSLRDLVHFCTEINTGFAAMPSALYKKYPAASRSLASCHAP